MGPGDPQARVPSASSRRFPWPVGKMRSAWGEPKVVRPVEATNFVWAREGLSPEFFEGLGQVTLAAAELEEMLMLTVEAAFGEPSGVHHQRRAHHLIHRQRTPELISTIERWYRLKTHTRRAKSLLEQRNRVVHAIIEWEYSWDHATAGLGKPTAKMRSSRDFWWEKDDWKAPTSSELKRLANKLSAEAAWFLAYSTNRVLKERARAARRSGLQETERRVGK